MKSAVASAVLGSIAHFQNATVTPGIVYTTEVVTAYTTYCPNPTVLTIGSQTHTVTQATTLTITNCPGGCTVTKPVVSTIPASTTVISARPTVYVTEDVTIYTTVPCSPFTSVISASTVPVVSVSSSSARVSSSSAPVVSSSAKVSSSVPVNPVQSSTVSTVSHYTSASVTCDVRVTQIGDGQIQAPVTNTVCSTRPVVSASTSAPVVSSSARVSSSSAPVASSSVPVASSSARVSSSSAPVASSSVPVASSSVPVVSSASRVSSSAPVVTPSTSASVSTSLVRSFISSTTLSCDVRVTQIGDGQIQAPATNTVCTSIVVSTPVTIPVVVSSTPVPVVSSSSVPVVSTTVASSTTPVQQTATSSTPARYTGAAAKAYAAPLVGAAGLLAFFL